ncbi:MAG: hypothetical protein EPN40_05705 [Rhodanobacteraceae bacterium]|nr:MAG: hypothetical protein EPN40_05705 [Rhodanobacteraceae bacterium]
MTNDLCATRDDVLPAVIRGLKWLFLATLVGGIALPTALLVWQASTPNAVIRRAGVGRFVSASSSSGFLQSSLTTVTTTQGSLVVSGLFSAPRNQPLEMVEWSQTSGLQLCAVGRPDTCLPLAGAWAGSLQPTAARARAFNFQGHGLERGNLAFWLFIGCGMAFMVGAGWFGAHAELEDKSRSAREPPAIDGPGT